MGLLGGSAHDFSRTRVRHGHVGNEGGRRRWAGATRVQCLFHPPGILLLNSLTCAVGSINHLYLILSANPLADPACRAPPCPTAFRHAAAMPQPPPPPPASPPPTASRAAPPPACACAALPPACWAGAPARTAAAAPAPPAPSPPAPAAPPSAGGSCRRRPRRRRRCAARWRRRTGTRWWWWTWAHTSSRCRRWARRTTTSTTACRCVRAGYTHVRLLSVGFVNMYTHALSWAIHAHADVHVSLSTHKPARVHACNMCPAPTQLAPRRNAYIHLWSAGDSNPARAPQVPGRLQPAAQITGAAVTQLLRRAWRAAGAVATRAGPAFCSGAVAVPSAPNRPAADSVHSEPLFRAASLTTRARRSTAAV